MQDIGKLLVIGGVALFVLGVLILALSRLGIDALPGDLTFRRNGVRIFIPLGTSLLLSVLLTILLNVLLRR